MKGGRAVMAKFLVINHPRAPIPKHADIAG